MIEARAGWIVCHPAQILKTNIMPKKKVIFLKSATYAPYNLAYSVGMTAELDEEIANELLQKGVCGIPGSLDKTQTAMVEAGERSIMTRRNNPQLVKKSTKKK